MTFCFQIVSGSHDHDVRVWSWENEQSANTLYGHTRPVRDVTVLNSTIASCSDDKSIRLWDLKSGQPKKIIRSEYADLCSFRFVRNEDLAISFSANSTRIEVWDVETGRVIAQHDGHNRRISSLALHPNGRFALTGSIDTTVGRWALSELEVFIRERKEKNENKSVSDEDKNIGSEDVDKHVALEITEGVSEMHRVTQARDKNKRVMVALENENEMIDGIESSSIQGRLGNVIEHILGRTEAPPVSFELEDDETAWVSTINENYVKDVNNDTSALSQIVVSDEDDWDELQMKERNRRLSSLALVFGFLLCLPWIGGLFIGGGLRSQDKMTR